MNEWMVCAAALMAMCVTVCGCQVKSKPAGTETVRIKGEEFQLRLSVDDVSRERGLKHETSIPDHGGMLFIFPDGKVGMQSFWMHECLVDMDLMFLDRRGIVTATHRMKVEPARREGESETAYQQRLRKYPSGYPAQFAIELKAGTLDRLNIRVDDRLELDLPRLKGMAR